MNFNKFLLPNSMFFGTLPLGQDLIAALFGLVKNHRELIILKDPRVKKANRYMMKQYKRLERAATEGDMAKYESISTRLLTDSKVYRYIAMHRTESGWFWELKACRIRAVMRKLDKIASKRLSNVSFDRTWIPKGEDRYGRPLGIPELEWRIWGWMNLNILEIWCHYQKLKPTWQHGGISGRGVTSAWAQIIKNLTQPNIIEFDIKGFFNQITHESIMNFVKESRMYWMEEWVRGTLEATPRKNNTPSLQEERPEFSEQAQKTFQQTIENWNDDEDLMEWLMQYKEKHGGFPITKEDTQHERSKHYGLDEPGRGTPQGYNTSPFLCVMTVGHILKGIEGLTMYMDDGIITAPTSQILHERYAAFKQALGSAGLVIAPNKTHFVKENGQWLRDLKFLGAKYIWSRDVITSETRAGTVKEFPIAEWREGLENHVWRGNSGDTIKHILSMSAYHAAEKYGLLGLFMSNVFAPSLEVTERELIEIGINKAYKGMTENRNTYMADNREAWGHMATQYNRGELVTSSSTRMIKLVLEKGFLKPTLARGRGRPIKLTESNRVTACRNTYVTNIESTLCEQ